MVKLLVLLVCATVAVSAGASATERFDDTVIARLAARAKPGEFARLETRVPTGVAHFGELLRGYRPDGSRAPPIDTWTDSAQWDPQRKRVYFQGLRQSNRFLAYEAATNTWQELDLRQENAPPLFERFGHLYGRTALDWRRGHFYRLVGSTLHRYVIDEQRWERIDGAPISSYISIDWHQGLDQLVGVFRGQAYGFRDGRWRRLGATTVDGYHSSAKFNSKRNDMLFIGGNHSRQAVNLLTADGDIKRMADAPFTFTISEDDLTHDPVSGNYLVLHRSRVLWEYNPDVDEWRVALDMSKTGTGRWPFGQEGIVPIAIDELDVIMWSSARGPFIYRHHSAFAAPPAKKTVTPTATDPKRQRVGHGDPSSRGGYAKGLVVGIPLDGALPLVPVVRVVDRTPLIEREARTMQPGEWRNIAHLTTWPGKRKEGARDDEQGVSFKSFQSVRRMDGKKGGADGMGWTQNLVYHEGKLMLLLMRDTFERALMVMEPDGRFWRLNQPEGFDQTGHRRPFNKLTQDDRYLYYSPNIGRSQLGRMIRTPLANPGVFESYGIPIGDSQILGQFAATYVPEWRRFYAYTPGGKIWSWAEGEAQWRFHGRLPKDDQGFALSGYAGLLAWNAVRKELVVVGGQTFGSRPSTSHKVYRLTRPLGDPEMLEDRRYPDGRLMPWSSGSSKLIVDPRGGGYIVFSDGVFYRNGCAGGVFEVYEDIRESKPFGNWEPYAPLAVVPGTDVVVFVSHIKGVVLHRLKTARPVFRTC